MGKVLVVYFSNSGCTKHVLDELLSPVIAAGHDVRWQALETLPPYPFPWTAPQFFETFPEALSGDLPRLAPIDLGETNDVDLVILGWQVWFLRPSPPMQAFLRSSHADILRGKRVISVVSCRQMWRTAYSFLGQAVSERGGHITDHIVVTHRGGSRTLVTTPRMLISTRGENRRRTPHSLLDPDALALQPQLGAILRDKSVDWSNFSRGPLLDAERVSPSNTSDLAERAGNGYMWAWGGIGRAIGGRQTWSRSVAAFLFAVLLTILIPFVISASLLWSTVTRHLLKRRISIFDRPRSTEHQDTHS